MVAPVPDLTMMKGATHARGVAEEGRRSVTQSGGTPHVGRAVDAAAPATIGAGLAIGQGPPGAPISLRAMTPVGSSELQSPPSPWWGVFRLLAVVVACVSPFFALMFLISDEGPPTCRDNVCTPPFYDAPGFRGAAVLGLLALMVGSIVVAVFAGRQARRGRAS